MRPNLFSERGIAARRRLVPLHPRHAGGLTLLLALLGIVPSVRAQAEPERGVAFLLMPVGAQSAALGQATAATGGASETAFWNPAGIALMERGEVAVHHAATFISDNTVLSGFFRSPGGGMFGITAYLVDFGSQEVIPRPGQTTGQLSPKNIELMATYATRIAGPLLLGVNYKLIQFRQDCSGDCGLFPSITGTTHGFDLGMQLEPFGQDGPLRLGAAIRHAGFKLQLENREQADPLPTRFRVGGAYSIQLPPPAPEVQPLDVRVLMDVEAPWFDWSDPDLNVGLELGYGGLIRLRTGYASINRVVTSQDEPASGARGPSVGIGLRLGRVAVDFGRVFYDTSNLDEPVYITLRADL